MSEKWSVTQWWLASLDQYGNAKLVDGPHASRSGVEKAFYIIQRLNLVKGPYACARVALSNVEPRSKGVNEGALDILTKGPHPMTAPGFSATKPHPTQAVANTDPPKGCSCSPDDYRPFPCPRMHAWRDCWWQALSAAKPLDEWHEDYGPVMWWFLGMGEPPYCGTPLDSDWPGYHTHWTPIPPFPYIPSPVSS